MVYAALEFIVRSIFSLSVQHEGYDSSSPPWRESSFFWGMGGVVGDCHRILY